MKITRRHSIIGILVLQAVIALLMAITQLFSDASLLTKIGLAGGGLALVGLLIAYLRGFEVARHITVILVTLLTGLFMPEPYVSSQVAFSILIAPTLALILTGPLAVIGSALFVVIALIWRAGWTGIYAQPENLLAITAVIGGMILARLTADTAHQDALHNAEQANIERAKAEERAAELDQASQRLEEELHQQRTLLSLVESLETPVVHLASNILFAPVVGHLDSRRADEMMRRLLDTVYSQRAKILIIDIAGVPLVDTAVAGALVRTVQGLSMLGCEVIISGISASVASTLVHIGSALDGIRTVRSPEEALTIAAELN